MERVLANPARASATPNVADRVSRWGDLRLRIASASVLAPLALICLWFGGTAWFALVAAAFLAVGFEWCQMSAQPANRSDNKYTWLVLLAGLAYAAVATAALAWLRRDPRDGFAAVLFVLIVVWCSDIGAYAAGRLIGGKRLAPRISPGKTWSGALGGLLAAVVAGLVIAGTGEAGLTAALLGIVSQAGDLAESALKRHFGVKDSGWLIPGHGGLLDRLDGLMAAAPVAAAWILWMGRGDAMWR